MTLLWHHHRHAAHLWRVTLSDGPLATGADPLAEILHIRQHRRNPRIRIVGHYPYRPSYGIGPGWIAFVGDHCLRPGKLFRSLGSAKRAVKRRLGAV